MWLKCQRIQSCSTEKPQQDKRNTMNSETKSTNEMSTKETRCLKKNEKEVRELKNSIKEMKNYIPSLGNRIDQMEQRISEMTRMGGQSWELNENKHTQKNLCKNYLTPSEVQRTRTGIPEKRWTRERNVYSVNENFPKLWKKLNPWIQEANRTSNYFNPNRPSPRHIILKM